MAWTTPRTWIPGEWTTKALKDLHIRDNQNYLYERNRIVYKSADEVVNNSAVLQDDDELLLALTINGFWVFKFVLWVVQGASAAAEFKPSITGPAGSTYNMGGTLEFNAVTANDRTFPYWVNTDANEVKMVVLPGWISTGANAGNLQLQWAQNVATAVDTTVKKGSYLLARKTA